MDATTGGLNLHPVLARRRAARLFEVVCGHRLPWSAISPHRRAQAHEKEISMSDNEHPKGALLFMLIFLMLIVVFWVNTYMRLWLR